MNRQISAIIQARMMATRLPGKVLLEVMGRPLLSYMLEALEHCLSIKEIIIATTNNGQDDPIVSFAQNYDLKIYRGSEDDVLDRHYQAAKKYECEHIMRLTADCPLIQPHICDKVAQLYFSSGCDYALTGQTFAEGIDCEIFSFEALGRAWKEARLKSEMEHVTLHFRNKPELFQTETLENETDDGKYRVTVDEPNDFQVVKEILEHLYGKRKSYIRIEDIKCFLDSHPQVYALNSDIIRNEGLLKSLEEEASESEK